MLPRFIIDTIFVRGECINHIEASRLMENLGRSDAELHFVTWNVNSRVPLSTLFPPGSVRLLSRVSQLRFPAPRFLSDPSPRRE